MPGGYTIRLLRNNADSCRQAHVEKCAKRCFTFNPLLPERRWVRCPDDPTWKQKHCTVAHAHDRHCRPSRS
eukprot:8487242-Alexandrium_andersonii.AAC.1